MPVPFKIIARRNVMVQGERLLAGQTAYAGNARSKAVLQHLKARLGWSAFAVVGEDDAGFAGDPAAILEPTQPRRRADRQPPVPTEEPPRVFEPSATAAATHDQVEADRAAKAAQDAKEPQEPPTDAQEPQEPPTDAQEPQEPQEPPTDAQESQEPPTDDQEPQESQEHQEDADEPLVVTDADGAPVDGDDDGQADDDSQADEAADVHLESVTGIGPEIAGHLRDMGITTRHALAQVLKTAQPEDLKRLVAIHGVSKRTLKDWAAQLCQDEPQPEQEG